MIERFADTSYFLALLNPGDVAHQRALESVASAKGFLTTH